MTEKMKGSLALLLASVIWGSGFVAAKIGSGTMSFFSFNGMRFLAAVLILLPFAVRDIGRTGYFSQKENGYELARVRRIRTVTGSLVCGILLAGGINLQQAGLGLCSRRPLRIHYNLVCNNCSSNGSGRRQKAGAPALDLCGSGRSWLRSSEFERRQSWHKHRGYSASDFSGGLFLPDSGLEPLRHCKQRCDPFLRPAGGMRCSFPGPRGGL